VQLQEPSRPKNAFSSVIQRLEQAYVVSCRRHDRHCCAIASGLHSSVGIECVIVMLVQMNDGDGSRSSEQESEGRADSGQSAVSFASCTLHDLLQIDRVDATLLQLL
jgi:hypothetical protein